jgi:hypothetical protein
MACRPPQDARKGELLRWQVVRRPEMDDPTGSEDEIDDLTPSRRDRAHGSGQGTREPASDEELGP